MACACGKSKGPRWKVTLPGGLTIEKTTEAAAKTFASRHPGSTVSKV